MRPLQEILFAAWGGRDALRRIQAAHRTGACEHPKGFTWVELKDRLDLPYDRPCPTWIQRMEGEIGLTRVRESGRAYVWKVATEG